MVARGVPRTGVALTSLFTRVRRAGALVADVPRRSIELAPRSHMVSPPFLRSRGWDPSGCAERFFFYETRIGDVCRVPSDLSNAFRILSLACCGAGYLTWPSGRSSLSRTLRLVTITSA